MEIKLNIWLIYPFKSVRGTSAPIHFKLVLLCIISVKYEYPGSQRSFLYSAVTFLPNDMAHY